MYFSKELGEDVKNEFFSACGASGMCIYIV